MRTRIVKVHADRESKNGTPYCALELPNGEWVFVWQGNWKDEIEDNIDDYRRLEAEIYVRDKEDDPEDHFYNLEAVVPQSQKKAKKFFERNRKQTMAKAG